jgi:hypothetical protein
MITQYGNPMFPQDAWAIFSDDDKYRYQLGRYIPKSSSNQTCVWCMLNPSTANAFVLDPTLRKCMEFSKRWGFGYMTIVNLFAYRATNPKELYKIKDPVGKSNFHFIRKSFETADMIVVGWGSEKIVKVSNVFYDGLKPYFNGRIVNCLGTNKDGSPKHPLYLPYTTHLKRFEFV